MKTTTTRKSDSLKLSEIKASLSGESDFLRPLVQAVLEELMEAEMEEALGARKGERRAERLGYRSGSYGRKLITQVGTLELRVPQDRGGRFSTEVFERYQRSEKALGSVRLAGDGRCFVILSYGARRKTVRARLARAGGRCG